MSNLWQRFDGIVKAEEVVEAKSTFAPIEAGNYVCTLEEIAPSESKEGLPMLKGKFRTIEGNRVLFYNQNLQNINYPNMTAVNVAEAVAFVGKLQGEEIEFTTLGDLADTVSGIASGGTYTVNVSYGKKDEEKKFPKLRIVETKEDFTPLDDDDIPF